MFPVVLPSEVEGHVLNVFVSFVVLQAMNTHYLNQDTV